jgi:hypothetical protein
MFKPPLQGVKRSLAARPPVPDTPRLEPTMSEPHPLDDPEARKANRLYWDSDRSVNAVAETLGVSKGRLYDLVRPLPVGLPCPDCGGDLSFPNRTARDRGLVTCDACGYEGDRDELEEIPVEESGGSRSGPGPRDPAGRSAPLASSPGEGLLGNPVILGGLCIGVVGGILLARWLRD